MVEVPDAQLAVIHGEVHLLCGRYIQIGSRDFWRYGDPATTLSARGFGDMGFMPLRTSSKEALTRPQRLDAMSAIEQQIFLLGGSL